MKHSKKTPQQDGISSGLSLCNTKGPKPGIVQLSPQTARVLGAMHDVRYLQSIVELLTKTLSLVYSLGNIFAIKVVIVSQLYGLMFLTNLTHLIQFRELSPMALSCRAFFISKNKNEKDDYYDNSNGSCQHR